MTTEDIIALGGFLAGALIVFTMIITTKRARCPRCGGGLTRHGWPAGPCEFTKCPFQRGPTLGDIT